MESCVHFCFLGNYQVIFINTTITTSNNIANIFKVISYLALSNLNVIFWPKNAKDRSLVILKDFCRFAATPSLTKHNLPTFIVKRETILYNS